MSGAPIHVGGSALPGGVMMRTPARVGIAVRTEPAGDIVTETFAPGAPTGPWTRWPLMRGLVAVGTAMTTGRRAMETGERLRWGEDDRQPASGPAVTAAVVGGALVGLVVQVLGYRVGPVVIAKELGLTGAAFIVADASIRLALMLTTLMAVSALPACRRLLRYHGAEHKAIAAFEAGAPLTPAAAAACSRFHPRCGTSYLVVSALVSIAVYGLVLAVTGVFTYTALIATRLVGGPVVTAIAFEIQRRAAGRGGVWRLVSAPGLGAQRLTTREPGPGELAVAIAALEAALADPPGDGADAPAAEATAGAEATSGA